MVDMTNSGGAFTVENLGRRRRLRVGTGSVLLGLLLVVGASPIASAGPPDAASPYRQVGLRNVGVCGGMAVSKNQTESGTGILDQAIGTTIAMRGVPSSALEQQQLVSGSCLLATELGVSNPLAKVMKFSAKLTSPKADCKFGSVAPGEQPLVGKVTWQLDTNGDFGVDVNMQGYLRIIGWDTARTDILWVNGMITKGAAVGATLGGNLWYNMVEKDRQATGTYASPNSWTALATNNDPDTWFSMAPGYGYSVKHEQFYGNCGQFPRSIPGEIASYAFGALSTSGFGFGAASQGYVFLI